jgi:general secretion pathway protein A
MKRAGVIAASLVVIFVGLPLGAASANSDVVETGRLLAILLDAGREAIDNPAVLKPPDTTDKNYRPYGPEIFERQVIERFKERTGTDLANIRNANVPARAKQMLPILLEAEKQTVADYQPIINKQGRGFQGFIPAKFGTDASMNFNRKTGIYLKQTARDGHLRNPENQADEFEAAVMNKFADPGYPRTGEKVISEVVDGGKAMRVMFPLFYTKGCLPCHGGSRGDKDITGYQKEGAKEGDNAGAISVKLPLK